jgi:hypothetical protein
MTRLVALGGVRRSRYLYGLALTAWFSSTSDIANLGRSMRRTYASPGPVCGVSFIESDVRRSADLKFGRYTGTLHTLKNNGPARKVGPTCYSSGTRMLLVRARRKRAKKRLTMAMSRAICSFNSCGPENFFSWRRRFQKRTSILLGVKLPE